MVFDAAPITENNRTYIAVPFNVWETTGLRGNIPCEVTVNEFSFECKLLPKGNGSYLIPIAKKYAEKLNAEALCHVTAEPIEKLTRINHDSPYSKEHPIRKIDGIKELPHENENGCCGHRCIAMLAGVSVDEAAAVMGKGHTSWSMITEALDYYGLSYAPRMTYTRGKPVCLPKCCIVNNDNHLAVWYNGAYCGEKCIDEAKTVWYLEIYT